MSRKYCEELTKEWLISQNIQVEIDENGDGVVYHWSKRYGWKALNPTVHTQLHEKGIIGSKSYLNVGWYSREDHRQYVFPYHRVLYAWVNGKVEKGYDVCHLHGGEDSLNNNIFNLSSKTHMENIREREGAKNQWEAKK